MNDEEEKYQQSKLFAVLSFIVIILMVLVGLGMISIALPVIGQVVPLPN